MLNAIPVGIIILDAQGLIAAANPSAQHLLGIPLEGMRWIDVIERAFSPQADDGHEVSLHDGRRVKLSLTPLDHKMGELIVLTDLTETRQLQHHIAHLQRLSALGEMMATLAHQIRTPLSAAVLYASHLNNSKLDQQSRFNFQAKLGRRLNDIEMQVNDLLVFVQDPQLQLERLCLTDVVNYSLQVVEPLLVQVGCEVKVQARMFRRGSRSCTRITLGFEQSIDECD